MHVKLVNHWFAPSEVWKKDKIQQMSGKRYRAGEHKDMPDYLFPVLPKSAKVIVPPKGEGAVEEKRTVAPNALHEHDPVRASADEMLRIAEEEEKAAALKEKRKAILAKAREAKAKKKAEREALEASEKIDPPMDIEPSYTQPIAAE